MRIDPSFIEISTTMALAMMALLGYVFAVLPLRRKRALLSMQRELNRAQLAVSELEKVVATVHASTAEHYVRLRGFKNRVAKLGSEERETLWHELCAEVEKILAPTLQLVSDIAAAQEHIRYQSTYLMQFSESQTDPLTGLGNRRALDCVLGTQFALLRRYGTPFSLVVIDIDHFKGLNDKKGHLYGDRMLRELTGLLVETLRTVNIVARYGGDEFVVVMPQTDLPGAETLAERVRAKVQQAMPFTVRRRRGHGRRQRRARIALSSRRRRNVPRQGERPKSRVLRSQ